jgi:hypothetical protein
MMGKPAIAAKAIGTAISVYSLWSRPDLSLCNAESLNTFCIPTDSRAGPSPLLHSVIRSNRPPRPASSVVALGGLDRI